jgi:hypothetical protein
MRPLGRDTASRLERLVSEGGCTRYVMPPAKQVLVATPTNGFPSSGRGDERPVRLPRRVVPRPGPTPPRRPLVPCASRLQSSIHSKLYHVPLRVTPWNGSSSSRRPCISLALPSSMTVAFSCVRQVALSVAWECGWTAASGGGGCCRIRFPEPAPGTIRMRPAFRTRAASHTLSSMLGTSSVRLT